MSKKTGTRLVPIDKAIISIQFWRDKHGVENCTLTTRRNKKPWLSLNACGVAYFLARNPLFDDFDLKFLGDIAFFLLKELDPGRLK